MSISQEFIDIREIFNNSRKEQRIAFLEVIEDLLRSIMNASRKPLVTPESIYFNPIILDVSTQIIQELEQTEPEVLAKFFEMIPTAPSGKEVSMVGIRKDRLRISEKLRDFYGIIGPKEADDIAINKRIFLSILEGYGLIEKQFIQDSPFTEFIRKYLEEILCERDEKGEMKMKKIEDITDPSFFEFYNIASNLFGEDVVKRAFEEVDNEEIEIGNYFIDTANLELLYKFLSDWNGITNYKSSFDSKTGKLTYQEKEILFNIGDNPYLILSLLYESSREDGIDLEDTHILLSKKNRWNKRLDYDQGGKLQLENVIKGINRTFKKIFSNQKLIRVSGSKANLMV